MKRTAVCLVLSALFSAAPLFAARPLATDDAGTAERGRFEAEMAFDYCRYRPDGACHSPGFSVKHGLTDRMDLGMGFSHSTYKDADGSTVIWGMSPLEIGFKMALLKERQKLPDVSFSAGYEAGETGYGLNLILSREYGRLGLHCNLCYNSPGEPLVKGSLGAFLAAEYAFAERYRVCAEISGEMLDGRTEVIGNSGLLGGSVTIGPVDWDLGLRIHDRRGPRTAITMGITAGF